MAINEKWQSCWFLKWNQSFDRWSKQHNTITHKASYFQLRYILWNILNKVATFPRVYHEKYLFHNADNGRFVSFPIAKDWPKLDDRTYNGRGRLMHNARIGGNAQAIFIESDKIHINLLHSKLQVCTETCNTVCKANLGTLENNKLLNLTFSVLWNIKGRNRERSQIYYTGNCPKERH